VHFLDQNVHTNLTYLLRFVFVDEKQKKSDSVKPAPNKYLKKRLAHKQQFTLHFEELIVVEEIEDKI